MLLHKVWLEPICHKYGRNVKSKELRRLESAGSPKSGSQASTHAAATPLTEN